MPRFAQGTPESEYINQYLEIVNYNVGIKNGYRGKVPGVSDISIKNNGDRNLSELMVTVYFQDESGKILQKIHFDYRGFLGWRYLESKLFLEDGK